MWTQHAVHRGQRAVRHIIEKQVVAFAVASEIFACVVDDAISPESDTQDLTRKRLHVDIPEATIRSWVRMHKPLTTYNRLRTLGQKLFRPDELIRTFLLNHKQVYRFQFHRAKLELFPHSMFQATEHRSSKFPTTVAIPITRKENNATRLATLVLPAAIANKRRHETLQRFMLVNDSATIAVEIPVYLTREDIAHYKGQGFQLDFDTEFVTGHLDFLQVRNGYLQILDYKPDARKEKHAHVQLTIYALALARRTNLPLRYFKCAWFDEKDYFEFFPLKGVYQRKQQPQFPGVSSGIVTSKGIRLSHERALYNPAAHIRQETPHGTENDHDKYLPMIESTAF